MDGPSILYLCVAAGCVALFCVVLVAATLADSWRERNCHLSDAVTESALMRHKSDVPDFLQE
jgi:hypothetical protein